MGVYVVISSILTVVLTFLFVVVEIEANNEGVSSSFDLITKGENSLEFSFANSSQRQGHVKRDIPFYPSNQPGFQQHDSYGQQFQPFCYDRYVVGNCKYRMERYDCENYRWTAYATVQNSFVGIQQLRSIPEGVEIPPDFYPGTRARLRLRLTTTCCLPTAQFLSVNPDFPNSGYACIVDVRDLQGLHPAEMVAVAGGAFLLFLVFVALIALCVRRSRNRKSRRRRASRQGSSTIID